MSDKCQIKAQVFQEMQDLFYVTANAFHIVFLYN